MNLTKKEIEQAKNLLKAEGPAAAYDLLAAAGSRYAFFANVATNYDAASAGKEEFSRYLLPALNLKVFLVEDFAGKRT